MQISGKTDASPPAPLRPLDRASLFEGLTLIVLLFAAVPLKHLAGVPTATAIMGPLHGLAFLFYAWCLFEAASAGLLSRRQILVMGLAAFLPGGFLAARAQLRRAVS